MSPDTVGMLVSLGMVALASIVGFKLTGKAPPRASWKK